MLIIFYFSPLIKKWSIERRRFECKHGLFYKMPAMSEGMSNVPSFKRAHGECPHIRYGSIREWLLIDT